MQVARPKLLAIENHPGHTAQSMMFMTSRPNAVEGKAIHRATEHAPRTEDARQTQPFVTRPLRRPRDFSLIVHGLQPTAGTPRCLRKKHAPPVGPHKTRTTWPALPTWELPIAGQKPNQSLCLTGSAHRGRRTSNYGLTRLDARSQFVYAHFGPTGPPGPIIAGSGYFALQFSSWPIIYFWYQLPGELILPFGFLWDTTFTDDAARHQFLRAWNTPTRKNLWPAYDETNEASPISATSIRWDSITWP